MILQVDSIIIKCISKTRRFRIGNRETYMKSIEQKITEYALKEDMIKKGDGIVVGVSGGADSVCLLVWLSRIAERFGLRLCCVHVHHGIRAGEADRDMQFTEELCAGLGTELAVFKYDVPGYAKENGLSEEEAGRKLRYEAFRQIMSERGFNKMAVAHHKEDSAETVLFNLIRGSGAKGLGGIPAVSGAIIRPLMCLDRQEIEEYLRENNIGWQTDSTNLSEEYSRNKIRLSIIPAMQKINEQAVGHILESSEMIGAMYSYIERAAAGSYMRLAHESDGRIVFDIEELSAEDRVIRLELYRSAVAALAGGLKDITSRHIFAVDGILGGQSGKSIMLPYGITVLREQKTLVIYGSGQTGTAAGEQTAEPVEISIKESGCYALPFGQGSLKVTVFPEKPMDINEKYVKIAENMYTKCMDCGKIKGTLLLRTRRSGDYLLINSGGSAKKLKEYFIEQKIPLSERDKILLLADGSHILWVMGHRMSDGCKLTDETTRQIEFKWIRSTEEEK